MSKLPSRKKKKGSKSDKSAQVGLLMGCPNALQNFALANDPIRGIIGTLNRWVPLLGM